MISQLITLLQRYIKHIFPPIVDLGAIMDTASFNKEFSFLIEFCDNEEDDDYGLVDLSLIAHRSDRPNISVVLTDNESQDFFQYLQDVSDEACLHERLAGSEVVMLIEVETHYGNTEQPITATNLSILDSDIGCYHKAPLTGIIKKMFTFYTLLLAYHYDVMLELLLTNQSIDEEKRNDLLKTTFDLHFPEVGRLYGKIPTVTDIPEDINYLETTVEGIAHTQEIKETVESLKQVNVVASLEALMAL